MTIASDVDRALRRICAGERARKQESQTLDFKEDRTGQRGVTREQVCDLVAKSAACLANAVGGHVVLGVANDVPGSAALTGTGIDASALAHRIWQRTHPPLPVDALELSLDEKRLVIVRILPSNVVHAGPDHVVRRRFRDECEKLDPQAIAALVAARQGADWSGETSSRALTGLQPTALPKIRELLTRQSSSLAHLSDTRLPKQLGLVTSDGLLTHAGELMLCSHEDSALGRALYLYRRTAGSEPIVERLDHPLPELLDRLDDLIWARRETAPVNYPDGTQVSIAGFPKIAVREALANALLHADWRYGHPVRIEQTPESLVIISPGPLVDGVRPDNVLTIGSTPRNGTLFNAATHLRMSERAGQGIDRIYRELIRAGQDTPDIENTPNSVTVRMSCRAPRTELVTMIGMLPDRLDESLHVLLALLTLTERRTISADQLASISQDEQATAECERVLIRLAEDATGILEPTAESAAHRLPRYRFRAECLQRLGRAVAYHRADPIDLDLKVRRHLADWGEINNRTLQNLFDVDIERARVMLNDLRKRGIVMKLPGPERGRGVKYGPGEAL